MRHAIVVSGVVVSVLAAVNARARADEYSGLAAYLALTSTPVGLIGPEVPEIHDVAPGASIALRYGRIRSVFEPEDEEMAPALAIGLPAGPGRITATLSRPIFCDNGRCRSDSFAAGLGWNALLLKSPPEARGPELGLGIAPSLGSAWDTEDGFASRALSAHVGLPLGATAGRGTRWTAYAVPGVGWAQLRLGSSSVAGLRATLGGGLAVRTESGIGLNVGLQKVLIAHGRTQLGVGVSWQRVRR